MRLKRGIILSLILIITTIGFISCRFNFLAVITVKENIKDLTEKNFEVLSSSIEISDKDVKEDFVMLNIEVKIEDFNKNKEHKIIVTNLEKFNDEKVRLIF